MNNTIKEKLKKRILDKIPEEALDNLKKDIYQAIKNRSRENNFDELYNDNEIIEDLEDIEDDREEETYLDLNSIQSIDSKVLSILHYLNISLYKKTDLKKLIINDMIGHLVQIGIEENEIEEILEKIPKKISNEKFINELKKIIDYDMKLFFTNCYIILDYDKKNRYLAENLTKDDKIKIWFIFNSIAWYIENHIDHEFREYEGRKKQIKKDLISELLTKSIGDIESHFDLHQKTRVKAPTKKQMQLFVNYVLESIDEKYIKPTKKEKKLNNEDYLFLKQKMKEFIAKKYYFIFLKDISNEV